MRVRFWGVRGSLPVPGAGTERYGGNTSCVEITSAAGTRIIIDGGTGIRRLGKELMRAEFESGKGQAHILVSHTHWDHIQGLPFFAPVLPRGQPPLRLRPPARRPEPAQRLRLAGGRALLSRCPSIAPARPSPFASCTTG